MRATASMTFFCPYFLMRDSNPIFISPRFSWASSTEDTGTTSSLSSYVRAPNVHASTHMGFSRGGSFSHMSHLRGRPESGSLKASLDGQEAGQNVHSAYSLPSSTYLFLPLHSAWVYSPARIGTNISSTSSMV